MTYLYLSRLQGFLEQNVCRQFKLKRPDSFDASKFELVHPAVFIGWPHPRRTNQRDNDTRVPAVVIGLSGPIRDDGDARIFPIQLAVVVYASGTVLANGSLDTDNSGYQDLLNFMDRITRQIINADEVGKGLVLENPEVMLQPDNEQSNDYWLGQIAFTLKAAPAPRECERNLL